MSINFCPASSSRLTDFFFEMYRAGFATATTLIMEDGTQIKLSPSESTPYENGVVTLYSHLASTIDLRKVAAINIMGGK